MDSGWTVRGALWAMVKASDFYPKRIKKAIEDFLVGVQGGCMAEFTFEKKLWLWSGEKMG